MRGAVIGLWAAIAGVLFAAPDKVAAQIDFSRTVAFGDSLTANDLVPLVELSPKSLYGADPIQAVFNKGAKPRDRLAMYAVPGIESPWLALEVAAYRAIPGRQATLISYEGGGNDVTNNIQLLWHAPPGVRADVDAFVDGMIENFSRPLEKLLASHPRTRFIVWTVPDLTITPRHYEHLTESRASNVRANTERMNQAIRAFGERENVCVFEFYVLTQLATEQPPEIFGVTIQPTPVYGEFAYQFADTLHPTAVSNAMLANQLIAALNEKWNDDIPLYTESELARMARIAPPAFGGEAARRVPAGRDWWRARRFNAP